MDHSFHNDPKEEVYWNDSDLYQYVPETKTFSLTRCLVKEILVSVVLEIVLAFREFFAFSEIVFQQIGLVNFCYEGGVYYAQKETEIDVPETLRLICKTTILAFF